MYLIKVADGWASLQPASPPARQPLDWQQVFSTLLVFSHHPKDGGHGHGRDLFAL